ncbi:hypothetical protein BWI17_22115 [Betaproteobacteria bacterium GR16-43]|nr:hypothetical protein BWI17_22115 [Betaproteobacteria bacterium GR16-43]
MLARLAFTFIVLAAATAAWSAPKPEEAAAAHVARAAQLLDGYRGRPEALQSARGEIDHALRLQPRNAPAYRELSRYWIMKGHTGGGSFEPGSLEAAEKALAKAQEIDPKYAEAYVLGGHLYRLMGRPQDAHAALDKAEALGSRDPWLYLNRADLLGGETKCTASRELYQRVLDSGTTNSKAMMSAYSGLICANRRAGKLDEVDALYKRKIAFEPNTAWTYDGYAEFLLCARDDFKGAVENSRKAMSLMDFGYARLRLSASLVREWAAAVEEGSADANDPRLAEARQLVGVPASEPVSRIVAEACSSEFTAPERAIEKSVRKLGMPRIR